MAIIISREEPSPPKLVPTSIAASARSARAAPISATSATTSAAQLNISPDAKVGTSAVGDPGERENEVGRGPEEPGGIPGEDRVLADELQEIAVASGSRADLGAASGGPSPCA